VRIERLRLEAFRNIAEMDFSPSENVNIVYGDNAQGKTNILEAVWLFTGARSFRSAKDGELIRFGGSHCAMKLDFYASGRSQTAEISVGDGRKQVLLNGIKQPGAGKLAGEFCAVLFSPDHLALVKQGPEHRRRMIDSSLCQAFPKYSGVLESYQKILKQRASLLRDIPRNAQLLDMLDVWDKSLADYGAYIIAIRSGYIGKLAARAREIYSGISGGKEELDVSYSPGYQKAQAGLTREEYREALSKARRDARKEDIALGTNTAGPHRDDVEIKISGASARSFGSQGQQRSAVLAMKLAECAILKERNKEPPVVLLDDVMSELDEFRRGFLLNSLKDEQIVITCCDASLFSGLEGGRVFHVRDGRLV
jgi:DNA replication and repair protein RecF